ncbi:LacI family DNA-binding transcriptional regulator [Pseudomonas sp. GB2N2]
MKNTRTMIASKRPSLRDVAKLAGVSAAAVSYVVNGRKGEVGTQATERIEAAIKQLKYMPQRRGLSLKLNREFAIGLVIVDPDPNFLADPFTTQVATGLSTALVEPGYGLTVTGCRELRDLEKLLKRPIGVDAFVVIASGPREMREQVYSMLSDSNLPVIVIQESLTDSDEDICSVFQDDFDGGRCLATHLIDGGARTFLFVSPSRDWPAIERREKGIHSALTEACTLTKVLCDEQDLFGTMAVVTRYLANSPLPDAIIGANDQIAVAVLRALDDLGVSVPNQIQVTGYNDFSFRNYVTPLLTTVTSNANAIGRSAALAILSRLESGLFENQTIQLPVVLNPGKTTRYNTA